MAAAYLALYGDVTSPGFRAIRRRQGMTIGGTVVQEQQPLVTPVTRGPPSLAFCSILSLVSDWNNGNAHFLRGLVVALQEAGHQVITFEPALNWSTENLVTTAGAGPILDFVARFPTIRPRFYTPPASGKTGDWQALLEDAARDVDVVIVHEWNPPRLVRAAGRLAAAGWPAGACFTIPTTAP